MAFYWDDLLDALVEQRNVVPIVGRDLLRAAEPDAQEFAAFVAGLLPAEIHRVAEDLGQPSHEFSATTDLDLLIANALRVNPRKADLTRALKAAHDAALSAFANPEPLRLLAEISPLRLFVTTTRDGLLARTLKDVRGVDPRVLAATHGNSPDLPPGWEVSAAPTAYHLFGKITATPGFALTQEDMLEFLWTHQAGERRPPKLFDTLRQSHLLLIGNSFPDWFARFFLRLVKGRRLSEEFETIEVVADESTRNGRDQELMSFLENFSPQTRIYRGGGAEFVRELHGKWTAKERGTQRAGPGDYEAEDMAPGNVFISYTRADYETAEQLWKALDAAGIDAWFDKRRLSGGDPFEDKIRRHISQCDLFLALVSENTEKRDEGFVFKEWTWALARAEGITRKFIIPLNLDNLDPYQCEHLPQRIRELDFRPLTRVGPAPELIDQLLTDVRTIRARRAA